MVNLNIIQAHFPYEPTLFKHPFDLVFIDPPFSQGYVSEALNWLVQSNLLKPDALVYIEIGRDQALQLPNDFTCFKDKVAGEVRYMLAQFTPPLSS
jgi:16S rRNA (guanine966-N2)-methyltransferase